jgi:release factor glutamine methyltransferase
MRLVPLPGVFAPPSDAWMLADHVERERLAGGRRVLDLCTGSGMLAIAAALAGARQVTAVDVSRRAVAAVRLNASVNGVSVEAVRGDLFSAVPGRRFDLILSNPPYLPGDIDSLPGRGLARAWEGGRSGRAFIDRIAAAAPDHLTAGGTLLLVCSTVCGEEETLDLFRARGLLASVVVRNRGPLGPRLAARAGWLRRQGLLLDDDDEEIIVVRAYRSPVAAAADERLLTSQR